MLSYGVKPNQIIFANPCKQVTHVSYAVAQGVNLMTFDNKMELQKVKALAPNSRLCNFFFVKDGHFLEVVHGGKLDEIVNPP